MSTNERAGYEITLDGYELLSTEQRHELELWAERAHLRASDNNVRMPPKPAWLPPKAWDGPIGPEDAFISNTPTPVDCAAIAKANRSAA